MVNLGSFARSSASLPWLVGRAHRELVDGRVLGLVDRNRYDARDSVRRDLVSGP
jgi:hypothetical protein